LTLEELKKKIEMEELVNYHHLQPPIHHLLADVASKDSHLLHSDSDHYFDQMMVMIVGWVG